MIALVALATFLTCAMLADSRTVILMIGPPGAGKTTQARKLSTKYKIPSVSMADLLKKDAGWGKMGSKKILKAEVESGELADDQTATFGLSQLMAKGAITLHDGVVEQRNFDSYVPPYMPDAPVALLFSRQGSTKHGACTPRAKFAVAKQIYWRTAIVANPELGDLHGP